MIEGNRSKKMKTLVNSLILGSLALASTQAAVLTYGTFTGPTPGDSTETIGGSTGSTSFGGYGSSGMIGVSFTVNSPGFTLSTVTFDLSNNNSGVAGTRVANFRLYEGGFGTAGGGTLVGSSIGSGALTLAPTLVTFNVNQGLTSGQTYWLTIEGAGTGTGNIRIHSAAGTETITDSGAFDIASGFRHSALDSGGGSFLDSSGQMPNFQVTVPEPHEYAMVAGLGLCAFAAYRRRMARVTA